MWERAEHPAERGLILHLLDLPALRRVPADAVPDLPPEDRRALAVRFPEGAAAAPTAERRRLAEASRLLARAALDESGHCVNVNAIVTDRWGRPRVLGPGGLDIGVSHDSGLLAVLVGATCCGVDVEDAPESVFSDVVHRFCGPADEELLGPGGARRLWTAKESAAKALGPGLRAGLSTINFRSCPGRGWASVIWRGRPTALWTRSVDCGGRHLAVTAARPARVRVLLWEPEGADGRLRLRRAFALPLARPRAADEASASRTPPWGT